MIRRAVVSALLLASVAGLAGCGGSTVSLQPATYADDPVCAEVTVRLPDAVDGQQRRWTDAQATGAWGSPTSAVLLTCGLEPPAPSTLRCITISGVDWLVDDSADPKLRVTTYGRVPAVQVFMDNELVEPAQVLSDLSTAVIQLPSERQCTEVESFDSASG